MNMLDGRWEARILEKTVVASGIWYYQNRVSHSAKMVRELWNYSSRDLPVLKEQLDAAKRDAIDFNVSDEGVIYYWVFIGPTSNSISPTFAAYFQARDHIDTYGFRYEIDW